MSRAKPIVFLLALVGPFGAASAQSLHDFMAAQKWDSAHSGPLIALETRQVQVNNSNPNAPEPENYAAYGRKLETIGKVKAVVLQNRLDFSGELGNPLDSIPFPDRLIAFVGGLSADQWTRLTQSGLAPQDVSGVERQLLLSLIPHPLYAQQFVYSGDTFSSDTDPVLVNSDAAQRVRLQMFKGLDVGYRPMVDPDSKAGMWHGVSSLNRHPEGARVYRVGSAQDKPGVGGFQGWFVENSPKPSQLDYRDPRLSDSIPLKPDQTLEEIFAHVRETCGVEIYPDVRIAKDQLDVFGDAAPANDLLKAIALCVEGTYRKVGPAYVLTADLEGQMTRSVRVAAVAGVAQIEFQRQILAARSLVEEGKLMDRLDFLPNDPFQSKSFLKSIDVPTSTYGDPGWFPAGVASATIMKAIPPPDPTPSDQGGRAPAQAFNHWIPDPDKHDKLHFSVSVGYRFILPDGTILETDNAVKGTGMSYGFPPPPAVTLPLDPAATPKPVMAGFRTEDVQEVKTFCDEASKHGVKEIWLETQNPAAVQAALDSGEKVDLLIRPWQVFKGEDLVPDVNVLGQTGSQLNAAPAARFNGRWNDTWWFVDTLIPTGAPPAGHLQRLAELSSIKGLNRIILIDTLPGGYEQASSDMYMAADNRPVYANGAELLKSLKDIVPDVYSFGFSEKARLADLRKYGIDPIDLENPHRHSPFFPYPYFESAPFGNYEFPGTRFMESDAYGIIQRMQKEKSLAAHTVEDAMIQTVAEKHPDLWVQYIAPNPELRLPYYGFKSIDKLHDGYVDDAALLSMVSINPMTAENADGDVDYLLSASMDHPFCFNFSGVPMRRMRTYFDAIFKPSEKKAPSKPR